MCVNLQPNCDKQNWMKTKYIYTLCIMLSVALSLTSCLKGNDDEQDYSQYDDMAITTFAISAINKYTTTTTSAGKDTTTMVKLTSGLPVFTIDQYKQQIYNRVPMPKGCDLAHVLANISSKNSGTVILKSMTNDSLFYYSATDSIDFSQPREIRAYALNGSGFRAYMVTLNVEGNSTDTKQWERVSEEDAPEALFQDIRLEQGEADTFRLSKDGGNTWSEETLGDGEDVSLLPTDGIAWVSFPYSASANADYELMAGSREGEGIACTVWRKIVEKGIPEMASRWVNIPTSDSQDYYLPKMDTLSLVYYNSHVYAIGDDGSIYKSRDGGLTWKITDDFTLPEELGSYHIKAATDEKGELFLRELDNGQLWHLTDMPEAQ